MGKLQAFVMRLGIDFNGRLFESGCCDEPFVLLVVLARGSGVT